MVVGGLLNGTCLIVFFFFICFIDFSLLQCNVNASLFLLCPFFG